MCSYSVGVSTSTLRLSSSKGVIDGIGHYTKQLIENFESQHIQYKGFAFVKNKKTYSLLDDGKNDTNYEFSYPFYMLKSMMTCGKFLRFDPGVDVFHCTDYKLIPMTCPTVTTLYDAIPMVHPEWSGASLRSHLINFLVGKSGRMADHVITISNHAAKDIAQYYKISEKKISVINMPIDDIWFEPTDNEYYKTVLNKYGLSEGYFLSVGTLQPRKNFSTLIDAYLSLPEELQKEKKLVIVGKYGWNCEDLVNRIQALQSTGRLIWLSNVCSDDDLRYIYKGASVFVFPSLYEGFGVPVVEAFASGTPVVCSNTTSLPEVSSGAALEVNPKSAGEVAQAMKFFATSPSERDKHIQLGRARASQLRWKDTMQKTLDVYKSVT
jgi:glycosyltransferase involved in cell wall biosynthesis